ncbi:hypothetical protein TNCV_1054681 [Trichonephila clavipes]|nr:hypothetical protein TNCV_1054681 [Trichonephila clavipes]
MSEKVSGVIDASDVVGAEVANCTILANLCSWEPSDAGKAVPFTSAKRIFQKKLNYMSSRHYAERNSNKIWWNNLKDLPMWPRRKADAEFCLTTGHDRLLKHLNIHVSQAPSCTFCDFWENM